MPPNNTARQTQTESLSTSRRNFLQLAAGATAGTVMANHATEIGEALQQATEGDMEVVWLQGQSCSGCTISVLQGQYPTLEETLKEFQLEVTFHPTIMAEQGEAALDAMSKSPDVLVVEGSVPTKIPKASTLGQTADGSSKPIVDWVNELAPEAEYVIGLGNCAAFGGWPAAENKERVHSLGKNVTGAKGLQFVQRDQPGVLGPDFTSGAGLPVINLGGCPPHPDYLLLTIATVLNGHTPELDEFNRPKPFYEPRVHDNCPLRGYFDRGEFADHPGDDGCLIKTGCAGPYTHCDDQERLWNDGTSVCLNVGAPCIGCMEPGFWDRFEPFNQEVENQSAFGSIAPTDVGIAALLVTGAGVGAHFARKLRGYGHFENEAEPGADDEVGADDEEAADTDETDVAATEPDETDVSGDEADDSADTDANQEE